jgi:hypothetical protein
MESLSRNGIVAKMTITAATAVVAFLTGWSTGGWAQGLGFAAILGAASGVAAFSERPGGRWSCATWLHRGHKPGSTR